MKSLTPLKQYLRSSSPSSQSLLLYSRTTIGPISQYHSKSQTSSRNVKVSVWWDFENCAIPNGMDALDVTKNITTALRANGIQGPVSITAFGDVICLPSLVQEKLSLTGVSFNHVPNGGKNTADRCLLADLVFWVSQNPPPAYMFLISSDQDFAVVLHRLRMNNYSVLLASLDPVSGVLASAASITWRWSQLVKGEILSGSHFNEPPDGPLGSWYSHNRKPLEDSIPDMGRCPYVQTEGSQNSVFVSKMRAVPLATIDQIRKLVNFYPHGVDISEFHAELLRRNVPLDKNLYGHKKFSLLLESLPTIVKLKRMGEGRIIVRGIIKRKFTELDLQNKVAEPDDQSNVTRTCVQPKVAELSDCKLGESIDTEVNNGSRSRVVTAEPNDRKKAVIADVKEKSPLPAYSPLETPSVGAREDDIHLTELSAMEQSYSIPNVGFFRRVWRNMLSHSSETSDKKKNNSCEIRSTSSDSSSNSKEPVSEEDIPINSEEKDKSIPQVNIFGVIMKWCVSWKTITEADDPDRNVREGGTEMSCESDRRCDSLHTEASSADIGKSQMNIQTDDSELFSEKAFWESVLSFLHTPKGISLITESETRKQMVERLQKEGPSHFTNLAMDDLDHLVNLLIYEKKWIEETVSNAFPFRLIHPGQTMSSPPNPHRLSSYFTNNTSPPNLRRPAHELENSKKEDTLSKVCSDVSQNRGKSKREMLVDCQGLVADMLKENPEGFDMSKLRRSFYERYGYRLSTQTLGFLNLATLLQSSSFLGVVVHGKFILPSGKSLKSVGPCSMEKDGSRKNSNLEGKLSESTGKDHDIDSVFKSLQPILETGFKRPGNTRERNEGIIDVDYDDSIYLSEEDSDSDGESPIKDLSDGKRVVSDSDLVSSITQELDKFYCGSGEDDKVRASINDFPVYSSTINLKPSSEFGQKRARKHLSF